MSGDRTSVTSERNPSSAGWTGRGEELSRHLRSKPVEAIRALVAAVDAKDPHTRAHSVTVSSYAAAIAQRMNLPTATVESVRTAGLLHDLGKIGVPDAILTKNGALTEPEIAIMRRHPGIALEILKGVSAVRNELAAIFHHHERYDGTGYPAKIAGEDIPIGARILAVADAVETMQSARSYKRPYDADRVRSELTSNAGGQFDPKVVDAALSWLDGPEGAVQNQSTPSQPAKID